MSTDYCTEKKILMADLFDGRLEAYGVREAVEPDTTPDRRCLVQGPNWLWAYAKVDPGSGTRYLTYLKRTGFANVAGRILGAIAESFETPIYSEHEPQFWGFATQAEWDAFEDQLSRKHDDSFYAEIVKYVSGTPNDIRPGTVGARQAAIAARLVKEKPEILEQKETLLSEVREIYQRDHAVIVTLTPEEIATVLMAVTHEDDMPHA